MHINCRWDRLWLFGRTKNVVKLNQVLQNICVTNDHGYGPLVVSTSWSFPRSWLITGFVTRLTRRVSLVEQELLTLPEHLSSPPVFSGVRVIRSLVLYVCFVDHCLSFCTFSFVHCVVCPSSIYRFWLPPFGIFKIFFLQYKLTLGSVGGWFLKIIRRYFSFDNNYII
jgi:hypothetical protein